MAACNFSIPFTGEASIILDKAKRAVENQSGIFTGDTSKGDFSVSFFGQEVIGSYSVTDANLDIIIASKPFMVPCNAIESFLRSKIA